MLDARQDQLIIFPKQPQTWVHNWEKGLLSLSCMHAHPAPAYAPRPVIKA